METKIKVSTEITETLKDVKPGDLVKSINNGGIVLVVEVHAPGSTFNGLVLDPANFVEWGEKDYVENFVTSCFKPFIGTVTLESR